MIPFLSQIIADATRVPRRVGQGRKEKLERIARILEPSNQLLPLPPAPASLPALPAYLKRENYGDIHPTVRSLGKRLQGSAGGRTNKADEKGVTTREKKSKNAKIEVWLSFLLLLLLLLLLLQGRYSIFCGLPPCAAAPYLSPDKK
jgi:hypothetical protein